MSSRSTVLAEQRSTAAHGRVGLAVLLWRPAVLRAPIIVDGRAGDGDAPRRSFAAPGARLGRRRDGGGRVGSSWRLGCAIAGCPLASGRLFLPPPVLSLHRLGRVPSGLRLARLAARDLHGGLLGVGLGLGLG